MCSRCLSNIGRAVFGKRGRCEEYTRGARDALAARVFLAIREIKIRVYGIRERQKLPRVMIFPPFFKSAVCRLPFAVFNAKRTVFAFVSNVSIYRKFFNLSSTFIGPCLGLMLFYFIFYTK